MSTQQFDILDTPIPRAGQMLIEAGAGTGKTFALTNLVIRLILEGAELQKILVVTFTNAATDELKTRIRKVLREAQIAFSKEELPQEDLLARFRQTFSDRNLALKRIDAALQAMDEASVFTIHGFCSRLLEQAAFESGSAFSSEIVSEADDLLKRAMADFRHREAYDSPQIAAVLANLSERDLKQHFQLANRFPDTQIVPETGSLDEVLAAIEEQYGKIREAWSEDFGNQLCAAPRNSKAPNWDLWVKQLPDALDTASGTKIFSDFSTDAINKNLTTRKKVDKEEALRLSSHPFAEHCTGMLGLLEDLKYTVISTFVRETRRSFEKAKQQQRILTYDDLIGTVYGALQEDNPSRAHLISAIRRRWSHALIDEFQDTDPQQYFIFREAFKELPLVFVGDPKQAIYAFRGADVFAYIDAAERAESRYNLGKNWRSTTALVEAVNRIFGRLKRPFINDAIRYTPAVAAGEADKTPLTGDDRPPLVWWRIPGDGGRINKEVLRPMILEAVVGEMQRLFSEDYRIGERRVRPRNVAVIVRKHDEARAIQDALGRVGIPSVLSKSGNLWKSDEVEYLRHLLRAILKPHDVRSMAAAMSTVLWGFDAEEIHRIQQDESEVSRISAQLLKWRLAWYRHGILYAINTFMDESDATRRLLKIRDGERRLTNIRHTLELLHSAERERRRSTEELVLWLSDQIATKDAAEENQLRLETDSEAVQIVTSHGSKGLQYDIVFAPYLWDDSSKIMDPGFLVHKDDGGMLYDLARSKHYKQQYRAEALSETLRLAYVTLTRAKYRCYVPVGRVNAAEGSALSYLFVGHEASTEEPDAAHVQKAIATAKKGDPVQQVEELVAAHPELMTLEDFPESGPSMSLLETPESDNYNPRTIPSGMLVRLVPWGVTSFSDITRLQDADGIDSTVLLSRKIKPEGFAAFAAGTQPGQCLHDILENADFQLAGASEPTQQVERLIQRTLRAYGLDDPHAHRAPIDPEEFVADLLRQTLNAPLPLVGGALVDVPREHQIREWRFVLPVHRINGETLAEIIARHADAQIATVYPPLLRRLSGEAVNGFFSGFADLVFEKDGRWFIYDWKSTLLGDSPEDYGESQLRDAALHHHYLLQAYFYAVGLHRYLKTRIPNYDYETHFGGAAVVFLRGIDGKTSNGFYAQRPPLTLIEAIDALFR